MTSNMAKLQNKVAYLVFVRIFCTKTGPYSIDVRVSTSMHDLNVC